MKEVIVIGAARSGTKIMRDTLAAAFDWGSVPYDIEYVWHAAVATRHDGFGPDELDRTAARDIRRFIQKYGLGHRAVVEKTVGNALRVPAVHTVFPDALFVHLVRDGVDVVESAARQWQSPTDYAYVARKLRHFPMSQVPTYGVDYLRRSLLRGRSDRTPVWGPRYDGIETDAVQHPLEVVCAQQWARCVASAASGFAQVPDMQVVEVRYEAFVAEPARVIEQVADAVGMTPSREGLAAAIASIRPPATDAERPRLPSGTAGAVAEILNPQLRRLGYPELDVTAQQR